MRKLTDIVIHSLLLVITIIALLTGFFGLHAIKVGPKADFSAYLRQDDPLAPQLSAIGDIFGGNSTGIALASGATAFETSTLKFIDDLSDAFRQVTNFSGLEWYFYFFNTEQRHQGLKNQAPSEIYLKMS